MALYYYSYINEIGKKRSGVIEAQNEKDAKEKLREQKLFITHLVKKETLAKQNLEGDHLLAFTIQLSQLLNAGIPLYESLKVMEEQSREESFHRIILSLSEQIRSGVSLSQAMQLYPKSFNQLYCSMVAAGEAVGGLGSILDKLAIFLIKQSKLKKQLKTALIYPVILGSFSFIIIAVLLGFVLPSLEGIFADRKLNNFTNGILLLSYVFRNYWWLYLPLIGASIYLSILHFRSHKGREWLEKTSLQIPLLKKIVTQAAIARFCRTTGTLLQGGLNIIDSLRMGRGVMRNSFLEKEIENAEKKIIEGNTLSQQLVKSPYIPKLVSSMLAIGEESGSTIEILGKLADIYEYEVEKTLEQTMSFLQPLILIFMGGIIGTILLAVLVPLTNMSSFSLE